MNAEQVLTQLLDELAKEEETVTKIVGLDQNGHLFSSWPSPHWVKADLEHVRFMLDQGWYEDPLHALQISHECTYCGVRPRTVLDGNVVRAVDPCPAIDGVPIEYQVTFPSGRIIVNDSLRNVYPLDDDCEHDYNTAIGQGETVLHMAKKNMAFGPVGNSCPTLYRTPTGLQVANYYTDNAEAPDGYEAVAHIITDLWAYSIADYQEYLDKGGQPAEELRTWCGYDVVDITPGTYRVRHYSGLRTFDGYASNVVYADLELIKPT